MAAYSKFIVAIIGAILAGLNQFFGIEIGMNAEQILNFAIPILTAVGVWGVANK